MLALTSKCGSGIAVEADRRPDRILILYATVGEGHAAAARTLRVQLATEAPQLAVLDRDVLPLFGWFLRVVLCDFYRWLLRWAPPLYGFIYWIKMRWAGPRALNHALLALLGGRALLKLIREHDPVFIVSTYPAATIMLGHLSRRGRVKVPVYATITDFAGLAYSAHRGIDLHLVVHDHCIAPVERVAGPGKARCIRPLVAPSFFDPLPRAEARRRLTLPEAGTIVVVSGGGWGVGRLEDSVHAATALPGANVVVLAGRNERMRQRLARLFRGDDRVRVLGFTTRMDELLAAADVLVHASGGVTCLEALVLGCSVVAYGGPPGHVRANDAIMASLGLVQRARSPAELVVALQTAVTRPKAAPKAFRPAPTAASVLATAGAAEALGHGRSSDVRERDVTAGRMRRRRQYQRWLVGAGGFGTALAPFLSWMHAPVLGGVDLFRLVSALHQPPLFSLWTALLGGGAALIALLAKEARTIRLAGIGIGSVAGTCCILLLVLLVRAVGHIYGDPDIAAGPWIAFGGALVMCLGGFVARPDRIDAKAPT